MFSWVPRPTDPPHVCPFTRNDSPEVGPFVDTGLAYLTPLKDVGGEMRIVPTLNTLYISAQAIREMCATTGSPIVVLDRSERDALLFRIADLIEQRDDLKRQLDEAARPDVLVSPIDVQALAGALVVPLSDHFSRKPGPKPKAAA